MDRGKLETFVKKFAKAGRDKERLAKTKHNEVLKKLKGQLEEARDAEKFAKVCGHVCACATWSRHTHTQDALREEKDAARMESQLIMSAFYSLGRDVQRQLLKPSTVTAAQSPSTSLLRRQREKESPLHGLKVKR